MAQDKNDKSTIDVVGGLIPENKQMLSASVTDSKLKDGKLTVQISFVTNFESLWGAQALKAQKEAVAMLLLELCETTNSDSELDFDFWEAEQFLIGAKNLKALQLSELLTGDNVVPFSNAK